MRQDVYEDLALSDLVDHFDEIVSAAYSVSLFTDWSGPSFHQVWLKSRLEEEGGAEVPARDLFGARLADRDLHPIRGLPAEACTPQMGRPGPWHERLPHFRLDHTPSAGDELQSEYLVARADAVAALLALEGLRDRLSPLVLVSEIRTVAADELWLSPAYRRDSVAIHFTWRPDVRSSRRSAARRRSRARAIRAQAPLGQAVRDRRPGPSIALRAAARFRRAGSSSRSRWEVPQRVRRPVRLRRPLGAASAPERRKARFNRWRSRAGTTPGARPARADD